MSRKRGNNEGSIHKRSYGGWRAQITIDGGRLGYTAKTKAEALAWLKEMDVQVDRGLTLRAARSSYHEFLQDWLKAKESRLTFESLRSYKQLAENYIIPGLGREVLRDISPIRIQRFYNQLVDQGTGKRTVQKVHSVIRASLNTAVKMGLITFNPSTAASPPKTTPREMKILNAGQVKQLLEIALRNNHPHIGLIYLAIVTGMRQGELLALHWSEVDLVNGIVNVRYSLKRVPGKGLTPKEPKTKSSIRSVKIGEDTTEVLGKQMLRIDTIKKIAGRKWQELDYVFPESDGLPIEPAKAYREFQKLLKLANLPKMRFHDLRHTAASLMLNNGVDVLVASKRLGHAKPSITLDFYGHLLPNVQTGAANLLEILVKNG